MDLARVVLMRGKTLLKCMTINIVTSLYIPLFTAGYVHLLLLSVIYLVL